MTVTDAVRERVIGLSAVTTLVPASRISALKLRQGSVLPAVLIRLIDDEQGMQLRGVNGFGRARIQVDAVAEEKSGTDPLDSARDIEAAIHGDGAGSGLAGWAGEVGSPTFTVTGIIPLDRREDFDPEALNQVRVGRDYYVFYQG